MPAWIKERAKRIEPSTRKTYGPEKARQVAFAIATQQAHALGKSPKRWKGKPFGTAEGRRIARRKYDQPEKMQKSADGPAREDVEEFLKKCPHASDEEIRAWATSRGLDPDDVERLIYELTTGKLRRISPLEDFLKERTKQPATDKLSAYRGGPLLDLSFLRFGYAPKK